MLYELIKLRNKLPVHDDYSTSYSKAKFCEESVECDEDYWNTETPNGTNMLVRFECEKDSNYRFRKDVSAPKNVMASILTKYLSSALKNETDRKENEFYTNVDLVGSSAEQFYAARLEEAMIQGSSYALPDSTSLDPNMTEAQKRQIGARPYLRVIPMQNVINWVDYLGHLQEAIVVFPGEESALYISHEGIAKIILKEDVVQEIGAIIPHGYSYIPLTRLKPFDNPFLFSGSLIQRSINQKLSLENLEIHKSTFTKLLLKGYPIKTDSDGNPIPVTWGNDTLLATESPDADVKSIGADVAQAASIATSYRSELTDLFQLYHLSASAVNEATQFPSGYSLKISKADFTAVCGKFVTALERFENTLNYLLNEKENLGLDPVNYSRDFIENDMASDLLALRDLLALDLGDVIKLKAKKEFATKYYNLTEQEINSIV